MKKTIYLIAAIVLLSACAEEEIKHLADLKIYLNETNSNADVCTFDVKQGLDDETLVFSVNGRVNSRFEGKGQLIIQQIESDGTVSMIQNFEIGNGFPSNVLQVGSKYVVFWNDMSSNFKLLTFEKNANKFELNTKPIDLSSEHEFKYLVTATAFTNGYLLTGVASYSVDTAVYKKVVTLELDINGVLKRKVSQNGYTAQAFGSAGAEELSFIQKFAGYFDVQTLESRVLVNTPSQKQIALRYLGDPSPVYSDDQYWIAAFTPITQQKAAAILLKHASNEAIFEPNIDLSTSNNIFEDEERISEERKLFNLRNDSKIHLLITAEDKIIVAANSNTGLTELHVFDTDGNRIGDKFDIGYSYPFNLAGIIETADKKFVVIAGTTLVKFKYQRVFYIKIEKSQLYE